MAEEVDRVCVLLAMIAAAAFMEGSVVGVVVVTASSPGFSVSFVLLPGSGKVLLVGVSL